MSSAMPLTTITHLDEPWLMRLLTRRNLTPTFQAWQHVWPMAPAFVARLYALFTDVVSVDHQPIVESCLVTAAASLRAYAADSYQLDAARAVVHDVLVRALDACAVEVACGDQVWMPWYDGPLGAWLERVCCSSSSVVCRPRPVRDRPGAAQSISVALSRHVYTDDCARSLRSPFESIMEMV